MSKIIFVILCFSFVSMSTANFLEDFGNLVVDVAIVFGDLIGGDTGAQVGHGIGKVVKTGLEAMGGVFGGRMRSVKIVNDETVAKLGEDFDATLNIVDTIVESLSTDPIIADPITRFTHHNSAVSNCNNPFYFIISY